MGQLNQKFRFLTINVKKLKSIVTSMRPTASTGSDYILMRVIEDAQDQLLPLILHLINKVILTAKYPYQFKVTNVISLPKPPKDSMTINGWRPINIVPSVSKNYRKYSNET